MFYPFSRIGTPGFNVRPQDDLPGFRLEPEEVPGFNIDENGLPRPRPLVDFQSLAQQVSPQASVGSYAPDWLSGLLALPQPRSWMPLGLRWPPAEDLPVGQADKTAAAPEPDESDATFQGSDPDAGNSAAALPWDDGEFRPQASVSGPWPPPTGVPAVSAVPPSADSNFVLANADDDSVQEALRQTKPPPAPSRQGQGKTVPVPAPQMPGMQMTESERRREQAFADLNKRWWRLKEAERRQPVWDSVIRNPPPPDKPDHKVPNLLPDNWEEFLGRIDPRYAAWTRAAAERNNIPAELLARLLYQESKYDKNSVSDNRKAFGIAQLTPDAVRSVGRDPRTFNYYDPQAAIDAGAAYLAQQYRQFKNWPKSVAAYNAGAGTVAGWLQGYGNDPSALPEKSAIDGGGT